jgi:hypothetical protein
MGELTFLWAVNKTSFAVRAYYRIEEAPRRRILIPFYDLAFLGGRSFVRGYDNYRFRANNLLFYSA